MLDKHVRYARPLMTALALTSDMPAVRGGLLDTLGGYSRQVKKCGNAGCSAVTNRDYCSASCKMEVDERYAVSQLVRRISKLDGKDLLFIGPIETPNDVTSEIAAEVLRVCFRKRYRGKAAPVLGPEVERMRKAIFIYLNPPVTNYTETDVWQ